MDERIKELLIKVASLETPFNSEDLYLLEVELERQHEEETQRKVPRKKEMYRIYGIIDLISALKITKLNKILED